MRPSVLVLVFALAAGAASAQDRSPVERQALVDLAYVLGESHALRQVCEGEQDQFWRTRMVRLMETEQPDATLERRLRESFNTGFATRQAEFPDCAPGSRRAETAAMARGRGLAARLARRVPSVSPPSPDGLAEQTRAR